MPRKKLLNLILISALSLVLLFFAVWNVVLSAKLKKTVSLYDEQLETNKQLSVMIESGTVYEENAELSERGIKTEVPDEIYDRIFGTTLFETSPVKINNLVYLTVPYCNFDGETAIGHMIVHKKVAEDLLDIFAELYSIQYPIEKMDIAEEYDAMQSALLSSTELASKGYNNTCALYYSVENGEFSSHSFGIAVDINPKINPSRDIYGAPVPKNAGRYANNDNLTEIEQKAKITEDSEICRIFTEHGWIWDSSEPCCFVKQLN